MCYSGSVRLVGGENRSTGRVEVCTNNTWGTVCDVGWDDNDAMPACSSAGFYWGETSITMYTAHIGDLSFQVVRLFQMSLEQALVQFLCQTYLAVGLSMISTCAPTPQKYQLFALMSEMLQFVVSQDPVSPIFTIHYMCMLKYFILHTVSMNISVDRRTEAVAGNNVTFWCNAESGSVANFTSFAWWNSRGIVTSDGSRINVTIHNASYSNYYGSFIFNSSLSFTPLLASDGDRYECELRIGLPEVGVNISNTTSADIRVRGMYITHTAHTRSC